METDCLQCGKAFDSKRVTAKFCSDSCKVAYNRLPENERNVVSPTIKVIGCLQCGKTFEGVGKFCSDSCVGSYEATPENERYLNAPIVVSGPMVHGQLYTDGSEIKLERGILRVRKRYEDPVMKAKEREELKAVVEQRGENRVSKQAPKRRGI